MINMICWICNENLAFFDYKGSKLLDEDGSKPCVECIAEAADEEQDDE
jgi:hypothetical protein